MEPIDQDQRDTQLLLQFGITHQLRIKLTKLESSLRQQQKPKKATMTEPSVVDQFTATFKADVTSTHRTKRKYLQCYQCNYRASSKTQLNLHYQAHKETGKKFPCNLCSSSYTSCRALKYHINVHNGEKPYKCPHCPYKAAWPSNIRQHLKSNHKALQPNANCFPCLHCSHRFTSRTNLQCHVRRRHSGGLKPFKCDLCEYSFVTGTELRSHMRSHTGEKPYACALCSFRSATSGGLNMHMRTHTGEKPLQCSECPYRASATSSLKFHVNTWHKKIHPMGNESTSTPFKCSQCRREYKHASSLKTHLRRLHSGSEARPLKCSLCKYAATTNAGFQIHMRTHTRERPFPCTLCTFESTNRSGLSSHIRTHTKEKPFKCSQCDYRAAERSSLSVHKRIHEYKGGRRVSRFMCQLCSKSFLSKPGLTVHIRSHTGEKPYSCKFCGREFDQRLQRSNTDRHEKLCKYNLKFQDPTWLDKCKSFKCQLCDFCTSAKENLKQHSMIHTGAKPHKCIFCETPFRLTGNKKRHEGICKLNPKQAESS